MMRWLGIALLAGVLAGCGSFESSVVGPPDRLEIGVLAARPDAGAEPAEQGQQLVDRRLRCKPYRLSIFGVPALDSAPNGGRLTARCSRI